MKNVRMQRDSRASERFASLRVPDRGFRERSVATMHQVSTGRYEPPACFGATAARAAACPPRPHPRARTTRARSTACTGTTHRAQPPHRTPPDNPCVVPRRDATAEHAAVSRTARISMCSVERCIVRRQLRGSGHAPCGAGGPAPARCVTHLSRRFLAFSRRSASAETCSESESSEASPDRDGASPLTSSRIVAVLMPSRVSYVSNLVCKLLFIISINFIIVNNSYIFNIGPILFNEIFNNYS